MTDTFRALRLHKTDTGQEARFEDLTLADLMDGDVTVRVDCSTVNYKDGLALTGTAPVVRVWPLIPGIDFAGVVETSSHAGFKAGDRVVLNGWGVGETHNGGYAQKARVKGDWLVKLPDAISSAHAMAIGTAGYTAMLCVLASSGRASPRTRAISLSPARRAASAASPSPCWRSSATGSWRPPAGPARRATICAAWAPPR